MGQKAVNFQVKGLNFEGVVAEPDDLTDLIPGVVICHPGPLNGGNMDNNVVLAVSYTLVERGFAVMRFNFRGVGNSEGEHSRGELEHQEALGALEFLKNWQGVNEGELGLAGYSFGNGVILGNAELQKQSRAFALISPSPQALQNTCLKSDPRPKFIITGEMDRLACSPEFKPILESFSPRPTCQVVDGADHFWVGREDEVSGPVSQFFSENLM